MERRALLKSMIATPLAAALPFPASAGSLSETAAGAVAKPAFGKLHGGWGMCEAGWQRMCFTGSAGDTYWAAHPQRDVAIELDQLWDGEMPSDEELDWWVMVDEEERAAHKCENKFHNQFDFPAPV